MKGYSADPDVSAAITDLRSVSGNEDVPEEFWNDLGASLADSRAYYDLGYSSPTYTGARTLAEAALQVWRQQHLREAEGSLDTQ